MQVRGGTGVPTLLAAALLAILAGGCEPKCREVTPMAEVERRMVERVHDRLDDLDVTEAQRAQIVSIARETVPLTARLREETQPRLRGLMAELKRPEPDRERLTRLIGDNVAATNRFMHDVVPIVLRGLDVLTPAQRRQAALEYARPSEAFEGSWVLDRGLDYFLSRIDATQAQSRLADKIKRDFIRRGRALQRKMDRMRATAAHEVLAKEPTPERLHALVDEFGRVTQAAFYDMAGYYLLFASRLDAKQRERLNRELVRFEPCPAGHAGQSG